MISAIASILALIGFVAIAAVIHHLDKKEAPLETPK